MRSKKNYFIFFPSRRYGGSELLFIDFFRFLKGKELNVLFVDYNDGVCLENVSIDEKRNFIDILDFKKEIEKTSSIIFTSISHIEQLKYAEVGGKNKVALLVLHKFHALRFFGLSGVLRRISTNNILFFLCKKIEYKTWDRISSLFRTMLEKQGLIYFNKTTYDFHSRCFQLNFNPEIFFLPFKNLNRETIELKPSFSEENIINFGWVSRLDKDLYISLKIIIKFLDNNLWNNRVLKLHIIGNGDYKSKLTQIKTSRLKLIFNNSLFGKDLYSYLNKNIDIGIGRGTINMNFSSCKIPSVLCYYPLSNDVLRKQFVLGYEKLDNHSGAKSFPDIINFIIDNYKDCQIKSFDSLKNYDSNLAFQKILDFGDKSRLKTSHFENMTFCESKFVRLKRFIKQC